MSRAHECAAKVLALAAVLDGRIPEYDPARVEAWADCFQGKELWPREAMQAVRDHYSKPNAFQIQPGDVIHAVKAMPVTSSPERFADFLARWSMYPYSTVIQDMTGISWHPTYPCPEGIQGDAAAEREFHIREFKQFLGENYNLLIHNAINPTNRKQIGQ
ncbi:hypothetical protein CJ179_38800 [Rhodococcus sp. ACS1]|uniref:hypothetical protein n=1 Tax=Rhodococcus sp. ACS1 TaxID=2028570 RepID=UPI000BB13D07|nr:hypothetical protein [Rhodococcus sp. ACS1]PBC38548.1 hypothetical protein CJ179_38800 [Rhodococcus sp. ACS1]